MYLTQMPLNPQRRATRDLVTSPQRMHAAVLAGFLPGAPARGRVLWRLDSDSKHELNLYVVSAEAPSFDALAEQAGWSSTPVWRTADYRRFLERLASGQRWIFRLVANPIRNVRDVSSANDGAARPRQPSPPDQGRGSARMAAGEGRVLWFHGRSRCFRRAKHQRDA